MKKILSILLVLCMIVALAACGAAKTEEPAKADEPAKKEEPAKAEEPAKEEAPAEAEGPAEYTGSADFDWGAYEGVTVEIMWPETDDTQIDIVNNFAMPYLQEISDEYGVIFDWVSSVGNSITTLAATGDLSDVWFSSVTMEMIDAGVLLDLTPYVTVDSYLEDTFKTPGFHYFNDHIWAISTGVDSFYTGTLYYNQDLFDELGITDISTYDKFMEACETLKAAGYKGMCFEGNKSGCVDRFLWPNMLCMIDIDAYRGIISGDKDAWKNPSCQASLEQLRSFVEDGYCGSAINVRKTDEAISYFANQEYGMLYVDSWNNGAVQSQADESGFEVGVSWWPATNPDYSLGQYISGWGSPLSGWSAKADTEYPELAVETIKAICVAEAARHLAAGLGTNHVQDGSPVPANKVEEKRLALYNEVGEFLKGWVQNSVDGATNTVITENLNLILAEDPVDCAAIAAEFDTAWQANTFFG